MKAATRAVDQPEAKAQEEGQGVLGFQVPSRFFELAAKYALDLEQFA